MAVPPEPKRWRYPRVQKPQPESSRNQNDFLDPRSPVREGQKEISRDNPFSYCQGPHRAEMARKKKRRTGRQLRSRGRLRYNSGLLTADRTP